MDHSDPEGRPFAVVHDIAASWQDYHLIAEAALGTAAPGLILHAAGPTQDGLRMIDVWTSEGAWSGYRPRLAHAFADLSVPPVVRELRVGHLISAPPTLG